MTDFAFIPGIGDQALEGLSTVTHLSSTAVVVLVEQKATLSNFLLALQNGVEILGWDPAGDLLIGAHGDALGDLKAIFPPQEGIFLIGPMAKIGWGTPTLISLSLGVIIEIPPGDVAILGILKMALPAEDLAILVLQVNFAGALEFDKQRFYFYASLFDSHVLFITITGSMGVLFGYGDNATFVVSVGGFHPQFSPPPLPFPAPERIAIDIINESYARIHADGYFAVTTNTVQFGTHASYFFGFSALSVEGSSGFDALIQFSPFHFIAEISTEFCVKVFGVGVWGVGIDVQVSGPTPWHVHGTASLSFFFFSIDIGIDFTWGDAPNTTLPPVAVMPIISGEMAKTTNWKAVPPANVKLLVSLRKLDPSEADMVYCLKYCRWGPSSGSRWD